MAMNVGSGDGGEEEVVSSINTTPLVDVMLVLLIIFLFTIPVVTHTVPLALPKERNVPRITKPENVNISVTANGDIYWNERRVAGAADLANRLKAVAAMAPQPEIQIRGDADARYEFIGRVVFACQRAGIRKLGFITEPPPRS